MAVSIFITAYLVRLRCVVDSQDCWQIFQTYFQERAQKAYHDEEDQELFRVERLTPKQRVLSGFLRKGDYGIASSLVNVSRDQVTYQRSPEEAELFPFYFLFAMPASEDCQGLLLLQRTGNKGVKTLLEKDMRNWISDKNCLLNMAPLIPRDIVHQLLEQGRIAKIRLVRYEIPPDIADAVYQDGYSRRGGRMELVIQANRGGRLGIGEKVSNFLQSFLRGEKQISDFMEIQGFDYQNVKLEIAIGGGRRTVDFVHLDKIRPQYNITDDVTMENGKLVFESIDRVATEMMKDFLKGIGFAEPFE